MKHLLPFGRLLFTALLALAAAAGRAQSVGIGTSAPTEALEVVGNVKIPAANDYRYATARTGYVSLPAVAFTPAGTGQLAGSASGGFGRWISNGTVGTTAYLYAPVSLPDGAVVRNFSLYVLDNDDTYNVSGGLYRTGIVPSAASSTLGTTAATAGRPGLVSLGLPAPISEVVDNSRYAYFVRFATSEANLNLVIVGARVEYTVTRVD
jgi:hypothetical protein